MEDDEFLQASRDDFAAMLNGSSGRIPVEPEYRGAVADALVGLQGHALLLKRALNVGAP